MISENNPLEEIAFLTDKDWDVVDGDVGRVIDFTPVSAFINGKMIAVGKSLPYAFITVEFIKLPKIVKGFITHKTDFTHLWKAFKERTVKEDEEVNIFWTRKHYKIKCPALLMGVLPKLYVMICPKGAFKLMTDKGYKRELKGEARFLAQRPIIEWKPDIMQ